MPSPTPIVETYTYGLMRVVSAMRMSSAVPTALGPNSWL